MRKHERFIPNLRQRERPWSLSCRLDKAPAVAQRCSSSRMGSIEVVSGPINIEKQVWDVTGRSRNIHLTRPIHTFALETIYRCLRLSNPAKSACHQRRRGTESMHEPIQLQLWYSCLLRCPFTVALDEPKPHRRSSPYRQRLPPPSPKRPHDDRKLQHPSVSLPIGQSRPRLHVRASTTIPHSPWTPSPHHRIHPLNPRIFQAQNSLPSSRKPSRRPASSLHNQLCPRAKHASHASRRKLRSAASVRFAGSSRAGGRDDILVDRVSENPGLHRGASRSMLAVRKRRM